MILKRYPSFRSLMKTKINRRFTFYATIDRYRLLGILGKGLGQTRSWGHRSRGSRSASSLPRLISRLPGRPSASGPGRPCHAEPVPPRTACSASPSRMSRGKSCSTPFHGLAYRVTEITWRREKVMWVHFVRTQLEPWKETWKSNLDGWKGVTKEALRCLSRERRDLEWDKGLSVRERDISMAASLSLI